MEVKSWTSSFPSLDDIIFSVKHKFSLCDTLLSSMTFSETTGPRVIVEE